MHGEEVLLIITTLMIFAGLGVLWMAMANRRAVREMEHRERLAMIQRGLVPSPEADPLGFELATEVPLDPSPRRSERWRSAGVTFVGLGFALMFLISFTGGAVAEGIGVGGAFAVLGAALLLNSSQILRNDAPRYRMRDPGGVRPPAPPPQHPPDVGP